MSAWKDAATTVMFLASGIGGTYLLIYIDQLVQKLAQRWLDRKGTNS